MGVVIYVDGLNCVWFWIVLMNFSSVRTELSCFLNICEACNNGMTQLR